MSVARKPEFHQGKVTWLEHIYILCAKIFHCDGDFISAKGQKRSNQTTDEAKYTVLLE